MEEVHKRHNAKHNRTSQKALFRIKQSHPAVLQRLEAANDKTFLPKNQNLSYCSKNQKTRGLWLTVWMLRGTLIFLAVDCDV